MAHSKLSSSQISSQASTAPRRADGLHHESLTVEFLAAVASFAFPTLTTFATSLLSNDPEKVLTYSLAITVICQVMVVLGSPTALAATSGKIASGSKKKQQPRRKVATTAFGLILTLLLSPAFHVLFILFGAPVMFSAYLTYLLSVHTAMLALFPLLCTIPLDAENWLNIAAINAPLTPAYGAAMGTVFGAWLGALPIPLDWDRDWQAWPITIVVGEYFGNGIGRLIGVYLSQRAKAKTV
ncbi:GPI biosynthesis protein family Pig-F-domain-containing protein [Lipomyces arxii]|uniref:GPI biosynthesis protein family Pig-F-domain-containing protein n=1 Tax=Lipomyces arxii TaxID=56418 RepID=UPI0034CF2BC9